MNVQDKPFIQSNLKSVLRGDYNNNKTHPVSNISITCRPAIRKNVAPGNEATVAEYTAFSRIGDKNTPIFSTLF